MNHILAHAAILAIFAIVVGACLYLDLTNTDDEEFPIL
jgi:hypothetical protein